MFSFLSAAVQVAVLGAQVASASTAIVCVAGQCLQGDSNTTLGVSLSASDVSSSVLLLPGQYTTTTNPQLVHDLLTSPHATLNPTPGFGSNSSSSLPLNVAVSPGLAIYAQSLYSGKVAFSALPSAPVANTSTPLSAESMALASNVWVAMSVGSNGRIVLWDSVPDTSQLPSSSSGSMSLLDMQSATCSSPCASSGTCSASGTCICAPGFNGTSCETCAPGFFGPKCQACPAGCASCDEGISGTGRCLTPPVPNPLTACNCLNGNCNPDGSCSCNPGWTTADNGTSCAKCASGFFSTSTGDCKVCQLGCASCADTTGNCLTCGPHFTQDQNDATKCTSVPTTAGSVTCPDGSFSDGTNCTPCSGSCNTCSGPTSNDCTLCPTSHFLTNNGSCVSASSTGVCDGSNLIADNNKGKCDTCGAKCTSCSIASFNVGSTVNQLKCTGCIKGTVLSNGQCIESCPTGTFLSPKDNMTCTTCDPTCSTCSGSSTSCLTCPNNQLASDGKCVSTCPSNTFSSSGACLSCHPDCATCTGGSFSQCASCPPNRPVLSGGRCLPTCSKTQFFDTTASSCQSCDSSCSSCSGSGPGSCLACSSVSQVLRGGTCVAATCNNSTSVIPGLGVCLSDLVHVTSTATNNGTISEPTKPTPSPVLTTGARPLAWWEILLMALGCAFIFVLVLLCWRRRARNQRAKQTAAWASKKRLNPKTNWRWRLVRFGEKLFGHRASRRAQATPAIHLDENSEVESEAIKLMKIRNAEEARHHLEMEKLQVFGAYEYSRHSRASFASESSKASSHRAPSKLPELKGRRDLERDAQERVSRGSMYSSATGVPRSGPEPRQPVSKNELSGLTRYPSSLLSAYAKPTSLPEGRLVDVDGDVPVVVPMHTGPRVTEAQAYADAVRPSLAETHGAYWIRPTMTGASTATAKSSNNPFRR
ncbi:insulin-like growth factor binding protein [Mycena amicta]|nr:insulin-like growth factor binding protein [Mycena amicta]